MSVLLLTMGPQLGITADLPVVAVGGAGVIRFRAIGAAGPVKWTLVDSTLPSEWDSALNPDGNAVTLTTYDAETAGTFSVTVRAVDSARIPVVRSFDVRVMALPLTISGAFPVWTEGVAVTGSLTISGGVPPYSGLEITSGAMPEGVSLSIVGNQIVASGTPTADGAWSATVQVKDSDSTTAKISLTGVVEEVVYTYATWDNPSSSATIVDGTTLRCSASGGGYAQARSSITITQKTYLSFSVDYGSVSPGEHVAVGGANPSWASTNTSTWLGYSNSCGIWGASGGVYPSGTGGGMSTAIEMAIDPTTRRIWVRNSGGAWFGGGNPETGTSPTMTVPGSGALHVGGSLAWLYPTSRALTMHSNPSNVTGTAPAGYVKGLYTT